LIRIRCTVSAIASAAPRAAAPSVSAIAALEERLRALEEQVADLKARLDAVGGDRHGALAGGFPQRSEL
jgi:uncharacterized protein YceH (UPF0502 family)